jgi:hypothetical protein
VGVDDAEVRMKLRVVIPTRNRAEIATVAVDSVLDQGVPGVSVLVSDNSNVPAELERLERAMSSRDGAEYVTPPEPVPMAAHWEWAIGRALADPEVTHVAILPDRRAFRRGDLGHAASVAERHPGRVVTYMYDEVRDHTRPVQILQHPWTGSVIELDSQHLLDLATVGQFPLALPLLSNGIAPREVIEGVRDRFGTFFASIAPDYCFAFRCLEVVDSIIYLDRSCGVQWALDRSHGFSQAQGTKTQDRLDFIADLGGRHLNVSSPLPELDLAMNAVYNEYFFVQSEPSSTKLRPVPRSGYLAALAGSIRMLADPEDRRQARAAVEREGWRWRGSRGRATLRWWGTLAGFFARRPGTLVRRAAGRWQKTAAGRTAWRWAIRRGATPPKALDRARGPAPRREGDLSHLPTLFEPPGGARVLERLPF